MKYLVIGIGIILLGAVAMFGLQHSNKSKDQPPLISTERDTPINENEKLLEIEQQLQIAEASGGMHSDSYDLIASWLTELESAGADKQRIKLLRDALSRIEIGGGLETLSTPPRASESNTFPAPGNVPSETPFPLPVPAIDPDAKTLANIIRQLNAAITSGGITSEGFGSLIEQLEELESRNVDTALARVLLPQVNVAGRIGSYNCKSDRNPIFTHHITDISKVNYVVPPPTLGSGPDLKAHSYIGTDNVNVPVYAPVDMTLDSGIYFEMGPYGLGFEVSCEIRLGLGHITEPVQAIKDALPSVPRPGNDTKYNDLKYSVSFEAGDLLGYVQRGNWDFGVYDASVKNRIADDPDWNHSDVLTSGTCPFAYFPEDMRNAYSSKFNTTILAGNPPYGESFCQEYFNNN